MPLKIFKHMTKILRYTSGLGSRLQIKLMVDMDSHKTKSQSNQIKVPRCPTIADKKRFDEEKNHPSQVEHFLITASEGVVFFNAKLDRTLIQFNCNLCFITVRWPNKCMELKVV